MRQNSLGHFHGTEYVHLEEPRHELVARLFDGARACHARVVEEDVDAAGVAHGLGYLGSDGSYRRGHIEIEGDDGLGFKMGETCRGGATSCEYDIASGRDVVDEV